MYDTDIDRTTLDANATLAHAEAMRALSDRAEVALLEDAAHWADVHGTLQGTGFALPGAERLIQIGGEGTPQVAEFACAELGAVLALSTYAGEILIADALDLRHRLPLLWGRICAGEVKPWIGRKTAQATRSHDTAAAAAVDAKVSRWGDRLTWTRIENLIDATLTAADPERARAEAEARQTEHGVWVKPSEDHETGTAFIRADAVDLKFFDATIDRIADSIGLLGDTRNKNLRRAKAVGILASPQQALDLYAPTATTAAAATDLPDDVPSSIGLDDADTHGAHDPGGNPAAFVRGVSIKVDPRPKAVLYVHLTKESLDSGDGVARVEGIGPVTVDQAKQWLGDCTITLKPVLDLAAIAPVDAYEIPDQMREAVHLMSPTDVFPFASNTSRKMDLDHTTPYIPMVSTSSTGGTASVSTRRARPTEAAEDHPDKPGSGNSDP